MKTAVGLSILALIVTSLGCAKDTPMQPVPGSSNSALVSSQGTNASMGVGSPPGYEEAYYNDTTVMINAIEMTQQRAPEKAQADFWEIVYPTDWQSRGINPPQCNPCDHEGNGIDFTDYHDHLLDSVPSNPGHGEYRGLWHVYVIMPAYNQDATHDNAVNDAYAAYLPVRSEAEADTLLAQRLPDGTPVAAEINPHFYFLCAVVSPNAAK